jgi:hypothetical protein
VVTLPLRWSGKFDQVQLTLKSVDFMASTLMMLESTTADCIVLSSPEQFAYLNEPPESLQLVIKNKNAVQAAYSEELNFKLVSQNKW